MTAAHALKHAEIAIRKKPEDAAGQAGWYLERERLSKGLTLSEAREDTGVPVHLLIALEQGKLDRLPPVDEAISLISAYGNWLGFDPAPLCGHYINLLPRLNLVPQAVAEMAAPQPVAVQTPAPAPARRARGLLSAPDSKIVGISVAAILIIFLATAWQLGSSPTPQAVAEAPEAVQAAPLAPAPAASPALPAPTAPPTDLMGETTALQGLGDLITQTVAAVDASGIGPRAEPIAALGSADQPPVSAVTENGRQVFGAENTDARVVLEAKSQVWLRVEDATGSVVATVNFKAGDEYRVPLREDLVVITRDGGLINYKIDGVEKGTLGNPGEIILGKPISVTGLTG